MLKYFIPLIIKKATRSSIWQKNAALNIFIGVMLSFIILEFLLLGIFLDKILLGINPDDAPELILEKFLIYYYLIIFFMRFYLQTLPTFDIGQFLHLPVKRRSIVMFMQLKSLTSFFNFIPLIIFLPFALGYMKNEYGAAVAIIWFAALYFFELTSNFILLYVKRKSINNSRVFLGMVIFFVAVIIPEKFNIFSLGIITQTYFEALQQHLYLIVIPLITMLTAFYLSYNYILKYSYLEDLPERKQKTENLSQKFSGLESYGKTGSLILNEIRLLFRNKRSKTILYMTPMLLLYGFIFYPQEIYRNSYGWLVFVGIFVTGGFMMTYGQYILSWESRHFDFILSSNISRRRFFTAKYYLIAIPTVALFLPTLFYGFYGQKILLINIMAFFYNLGVNAPLLLFTASFNRKRMDLSKGASFNYQGVGVNNFLVVIPLIVMPSLLFVIFKAIWSADAAMIILTAMGMTGILLHRILIEQAVKFFEKNRYKIAEGFRQS